MKNTNEVIIAESVIKSISDLDVQNYLEGIREVTEKYLYHCAKAGSDPEFGYTALMNVTALLKKVQKYHEQASEMLKVA